MNLQPIDIAVALSLYAQNVSAQEMATAIYRHFKGDCTTLDRLVRAVQHGYGATELAPPSVLVYVEQALAKYGEEAAKLNRVNGI